MMPASSLCSCTLAYVNAGRTKQELKCSQGLPFFPAICTVQEMDSCVVNLLPVVEVAVDELASTCLSIRELPELCFNLRERSLCGHCQDQCCLAFLLDINSLLKN